MVRLRKCSTGATAGLPAGAPPRALSPAVKPPVAPKAGLVIEKGGFTLMEILAAIMILGTAMFVLMGAHHQGLLLHQAVDQEVTFRLLLERSVALAEVEALTGALSGGGDFGERYPGFEWEYEATKDEDDLVPLYLIEVTVRGAEEERSLRFVTFNTGPEDTEGGTGRDRWQRNRR